MAVALTGAILYADLTQNLGGVYTNPNPNAYPISAYSYFIAQCVPSQAAAQSFACDSSGNVTMGTAQGAELAQFIAFVACLGPGQNGRARLFAHSRQPGPGRLPGRRSPARRHGAGATDAAELRRTPTSPGSCNHRAVPRRCRRPTQGSDLGPTTAGTTRP